MSAASILAAKGGRLIPVSPSVCFTDIATTTNASVGQQVAAVSHAGAYFRVPDGGAKPTLRNSGSVYWLEFPVYSELYSETIGVSSSSDHARGVLFSSSNTSSYIRVWNTRNASSGNVSCISTVGLAAGKGWLHWKNDAGSSEQSISTSANVGGGIVAITAVRRSGNIILRTNAAEYASQAITVSGAFYPSRAEVTFSDQTGNVYAFWDCPTSLTDGELAEIENDLGTLAGASWASSGGSSVTGNATIAIGDVTLSADGSVTAGGGVNAAAAIQLDAVTLTADGAVTGASGSITLPVAMRTMANKMGGLHASATVTVLAIDCTTGQVAASYTLATDANGVLTTYTLTGLVSGRAYALVPFVGTVASGVPGHAAALTAA